MYEENRSFFAEDKPRKAHAMAAAQNTSLYTQAKALAVPNQKRGRERRDGRLLEVPICMLLLLLLHSAPICATQPSAALHRRFRKFAHHMDSSVPLYGGPLFPPLDACVDAFDPPVV